jgi:hypothetical protein
VAAVKPEPKKDPAPVERAAPPPHAPRGASAKLNLRTVPSGLVVKLGARVLGKTPLVGVPLPLGHHTLSVQNTALGISKTLTVDAADASPINESLTVGKATIRVNSRPWAEVFIDGRSVGNTPVQRPVYEGKHEIRLVSPEAGERTELIELKPGEEKDLRVKF